MVTSEMASSEIPRWQVCAILVLTLTARPLSAQDESQLAGLYEQLVRPDQVLPVALGQQALRSLEPWQDRLAELTAPQRRQVLLVETFAALAVGDAARARDRAAELHSTQPDDPLVLRTSLLAATAAGDAQTCEQVLRALPDKPETTGQTGTSTSLARRRLLMVGRPAPDVALRGPSREVNPSEPGGILVLDFWNLRNPPSEKLSAALVELASQYGDAGVTFIGVNSDGPARLDEARRLAAERGYTWDQHYEQKSANAPITHQAFKAGTGPWQVLVDASGIIRAVGDASEPGWQYALRAAVAEVRGDFPPVTPRARDGTSPQVARSRREASAPPAAARQTPRPPQAQPELPSNPEAAEKLRMARLFLKTGKKTDARRLLQEIVQNYPGTPEARQAQEILDTLP